MTRSVFKSRSACIAIVRSACAFALFLNVAVSAKADANPLSSDEVVYRTGFEPTICGDGVVEDYETCDDSGGNAGDGCGAGCLIERGFFCAGEPSVCVTACGDGVIAGAEACDDGNANDGDGCDSTCAVQSGFECGGEPSACVTECGDGIVAGAETCDDANGVNRDGCSSTCAVELGYACSGNPSTCAAPVVGGCESVPTPAAAGFTQSPVPREWRQLAGAPLFPDYDLSNPDRIVPAYLPAGLTFLGASRKQWTSMAFTTKEVPTQATGRLAFDPSQIPGTFPASTNVRASITRCPGDFRLVVDDPKDPTDYPACRTYQCTGDPLSCIPRRTIQYNYTGLGSPEGTSCGLLPGHTYYLNYINATVGLDGHVVLQHTCPNDVDTCGVQLSN